MSSREVMEDDPDRWYKMVLEDEQEMKSLDGSEEQRARAKEWQMIVKEFSFLTYEYMIEEDEEELAQHAWAGSDDNLQDRLLKKRYDAYKWIVYGIKPYYMEPEYIHKMELKDRQYKRAAKNLSKKNVKRVRRFTTHKSNTTYSGLVPLRTWLEHREGEQGKLKLGKRGMDEVERNFRNRHRDVLDTANVAGMEVSQLTEGQLRKIVSQNECGPKIVQIENQGKIELYVTLLSLGPNTAMKTIPVPAVDDHPPQESDTPTFSGRENEVVIGGSFGQDPTNVITRINRKTPDQRSVGKSKRDRLRKARKPEKDLKEKEQRENRSAKKRLRRQQQLSEDPEARESKTKKTVDNGGEKVTPEVRRLLGKSHKPKIVNKRKVKDIETSKEIAELTRRKHKEQESSKWKTGMRVAAHEDRQQRRSTSQVTTDSVKSNFDVESQNLPCSQATFPDGSEVGRDSPPSSPPQSTANSTQATFPGSNGYKFTDNHNIPSSSSPQSTTASVVSSQATFSDLYRSTFPDKNTIGDGGSTAL